MRRLRGPAARDATQSQTAVLERPDDVIGWPGRACCCPAEPVVKVLLPTFRQDSAHIVDLYLCGHHYRKSFGTLVDSGATTITLLRTPAAF